MDRQTLLEFMRAQPWAVQASTSATGAPQAAVIGVVVTDALELFRVRPSWIRYSDFRVEPPKIALFWCEDGDNPTAFLTALEACVLDPARFNHRGHIFAAWAYLRTYGAIEGAQRFETALRRYANHLGATQKYHATITFALLRLMNVRIAREASCSWEDFANRNDDLFRSATTLLETHYSRERLDSAEAKTRVLASDRAPLPELAD